MIIDIAENSLKFLALMFFAAMESVFFVKEIPAAIAKKYEMNPSIAETRMIIVMNPVCVWYGDLLWIVRTRMLQAFIMFNKKLILEV